MFLWLPHHTLQYGAWTYREEIDNDLSRGKNNGFWLLWGTFDQYIKENVMKVLRKAKSHSVYIWFADWQKNQCKRRSRSKIYSNFDFFQAVK